MGRLTRIGTLFALVALGACSAEVGDACDGDSDCESGTTCVPPGSPMVCGICSAEPRTCASDPDCDVGSHCEEYQPLCPPCDGVLPTRCAVDCTAGSCPEDQRCDLDRGRCVPLACSSGEYPYECPSNLRCAPEAVGADEHGCQRLACDRDRDCDHGDCVSGLCYDGAGTCLGPVP